MARVPDSAQIGLDVVDSLLNGRDFLGVFVRDFALELFFQRHHEFDGIQRVGTQIIDKGSVFRHVLFLGAELLGDDFFNAFFDVANAA